RRDGARQRRGRRHQLVDVRTTLAQSDQASDQPQRSRAGVLDHAGNGFRWRRRDAQLGHRLLERVDLLRQVGRRARCHRGAETLKLSHDRQARALELEPAPRGGTLGRRRPSQPVLFRLDGGFECVTRVGQALLRRRRGRRVRVLFQQCGASARDGERALQGLARRFLILRGEQRARAIHLAHRHTRVAIPVDRGIQRRHDRLRRHGGRPRGAGSGLRAGNDTDTDEQSGGEQAEPLDSHQARHPCTQYLCRRMRLDRSRMGGMKPAVGTVTIGAALALMALGPASATAQHRGGQARSGMGARNFSHNNFGDQHNFHHHRGSRFIVVAPFVPFGYTSAFVDPSPVVYAAPPPMYYPPPTSAYGPPSAYAAPPPPSYAPPTAQPQLQQDLEPIQREVVFPTGRYVLRGDGINTPYTWVWIPNPPKAPPGGASPAHSRTRDADRAICAWTDGNGITTWTDRLSQVPPEHRATARRDF